MAIHLAPDQSASITDAGPGGVALLEMMRSIDEAMFGLGQGTVPVVSHDSLHVLRGWWVRTEIDHVHHAAFNY